MIQYLNFNCFRLHSIHRYLLLRTLLEMSHLKLYIRP